LTIVTSSRLDPFGDIESIQRVTGVSGEGISLAMTGQVVNDPDVDGDRAGLAHAGGGAARVPAARSVAITRTVRREDLQHAREYMQAIDEYAPPAFPGTTAITVSTAVLEDLKKNGESELTVGIGRVPVPDGAGDLLGGLLSEFAAELNGVIKVSGTLTRVEPQAIRFRVLLNDEPAELPAIHARGTLSGPVGSGASEFWILDDPAHPLVLSWGLEGFGRMRVIKISFAPEPDVSASPRSLLARELTEGRRAALYGIHFDFGSDRIREESEPQLAEIARVLAANPAWALSIEGHTDDIGEPARNLDLSQRRAAAVKDALTTRYRVDAARLTTSGHGESRPLDTNDTLEGRARNRRVELVRQP
jgi:hypothetical protein